MSKHKKDDISLTKKSRKQMQKSQSFDWLFYLAERTGLEPATPGVTGRYSNQLNYRSEFIKTT